MRFLADESFPRSTVRLPRERGFELAWVSEDSAGSTDAEVLTRCTRDNLTLLTLDKDFGELVFHLGLPAECGVLLFRVEAASPTIFSEVVLAALRSRDDWSGCFAVVTRNRIRIKIRSFPKS